MSWEVCNLDIFLKKSTSKLQHDIYTINKCKHQNVNKFNSCLGLKAGENVREKLNCLLYSRGRMGEEIPYTERTGKLLVLLRVYKSGVGISWSVQPQKVYSSGRGGWGLPYTEKDRKAGGTFKGL